MKGLVKKLKPSPERRTRVRDAANRPAVGYIKRSIKVPSDKPDQLLEYAQEWVEVRVLRFGKKAKRRRLVMLYCRDAQGKGDFEWADYVYLHPDEGSPTILAALMELDPRGHWWMGSNGALERPATIYEAAHPELPPRPVWMLLNSQQIAGLIHVRKTEPGAPAESDLDNAFHHMKRAKRAKKIAMFEERLAHWEHRARVAKNKIKKYTYMLKRAQKAGT